MRWLDAIIDSMDMSLSKSYGIVKDRKAWSTAVHRVAKSQTDLQLNNNKSSICEKYNINKIRYNCIELSDSEYKVTV